MEQAPLISIIMPVYNAGVLLHIAVESVLCQSFADFELLLVDDEETLLLNDELLKGLDEELDAFLKDLLER